MQIYTVYHLHTDLSSGVTNIDSVTKYHQYVNKAKELMENIEKQVMVGNKWLTQNFLILKFLILFKNC